MCANFPESDEKLIGVDIQTSITYRGLL